MDELKSRSGRASTLLIGVGLVITVALSCVVPSAHAEPEEKLPAAVTEADGKIATEIERRLSRDPNVNATAVELEVRDGAVTLRGRVPSEEAKKRAEKIASDVDGVSRVRNLLSVGTAAGQREDPGPGRIPERVPGHE